MEVNAFLDSLVEEMKLAPKLYHQFEKLQAENKRQAAELDQQATELEKNEYDCLLYKDAVAQDRKKLEARIKQLKDLLKYPYSLPMNEAGNYDENVRWLDEVEQALKGDL